MQDGRLVKTRVKCAVGRTRIEYLHGSANLMADRVVRAQNRDHIVFESNGRASVQAEPNVRCLWSGVVNPSKDIPSKDDRAKDVRDVVAEKIDAVSRRRIDSGVRPFNYII